MRFTRSRRLRPPDAEGLFDHVAARRRLEQRVDRYLDAARRDDPLRVAEAERERAAARTPQPRPAPSQRDAWEEVQQGFAMSADPGAVRAHDLEDAVMEHPRVQEALAGIREEGLDWFRRTSELRFYWAVIEGDRDTAMEVARQEAGKPAFERECEDIEHLLRHELWPMDDATRRELQPLKAEGHAAMRANSVRRSRTLSRQIAAIEDRYYADARHREMQHREFASPAAASAADTIDAATATASGGASGQDDTGKPMSIMDRIREFVVERARWMQIESRNAAAERSLHDQQLGDAETERIFEECFIVDDLNREPSGTTLADRQSRLDLLDGAPTVRDVLRTPAEREERERRIQEAELTHLRYAAWPAFSEDDRAAVLRHLRGPRRPDFWELSTRQLDALDAFAELPESTQAELLSEKVQGPASDPAEADRGVGDAAGGHGTGPNRDVDREPLAQPSLDAEHPDNPEAGQAVDEEIAAGELTRGGASDPLSAVETPGSEAHTASGSDQSAASNGTWTKARNADSGMEAGR